MMDKLSEIEILTVDGKKQYMCTSEIWEIADKVNEIIDYINRQENKNEAEIRADERRKVCQEIREFAHSEKFLQGLGFLSLLHELDKIEEGESK